MEHSRVSQPLRISGFCYSPLGFFALRLPPLYSLNRSVHLTTSTMQYGTECWCGTSDNATDYERHGEGSCYMGCSGDESVACGTYVDGSRVTCM